MTRWATLVVAWGSAVAVLGLQGRAGWVESLFLLAPTVVVPVARAVAGAASDRKRLPWGLLPWTGAALLVPGSFLVEPGRLAGGLVCPWLGVALAGALLALRDLMRARPLTLERICNGVAALYLPVGAGWLVASRLGVAPMGFREPIVQLTAVHFHFTGFAAPVIAGRVVRIAGGRSARGCVGIAAGGLLLGTPLLATGFVLSPPLKVVAVLLLVVSLSLLSWLLLSNRRSLPGGLPRALATIAALSLPVGMSLTAVYGIGEFVGIGWITIPQMALFHGLANGVGFSLCGLLAFRLADARSGETEGSS